MDRYQAAVRRLRAVLADIPEIDAKTYKLKVGGDGAAAPIELTLDDLKNAGVRSGGRQSVFRQSPRQENATSTPITDVRAHLQPGRLPQQCDAKYHIERIGGSYELC
jgi:hypothetical protein